MTSASPSSSASWGNCPGSPRSATPPASPTGSSRAPPTPPGVPRLGVPGLVMSDASMGVTNPGYGGRSDTATAMPACIALGASFNPALARAAVGAIVPPNLELRRTFPSWGTDGFHVDLVFMHVVHQPEFSVDRQVLRLFSAAPDADEAATEIVERLLREYPDD